MRQNTEWMDAKSVARYFGFSNFEQVKDWGIPHLSVTTGTGRTVRRFKRSDVERFEKQNFNRGKTA